MSGAVARRYATALFEVASERKVVDAVQEELTAVAGIISTNPALQKILEHPHIATSVKNDLLKKLFAEKLNEVTTNFLQLVVNRRREGSLEDVKDHFVELANEAKGVAEATVTTAKELSTEELNQLQEKFGKLLNKTLHVTTQVNPSLFGGVVVRIGDRLFDGSVSGKLARFQQNLKQSQVR
jgi:F-type H+-transporting ATPase subunit delta